MAASTGKLVSDLTEQTSRLAKAEAKLAIREVTTKMKHAAVGGGAFGAAGILAFYGGMLLLACMVLGLVAATAMAGWLAALIIGVAVLLCAAIAAMVGKSQLKKGLPPVPDDAVARVREDIEVVTHHGKGDST
jgi:membrane protein